MKPLWSPWRVEYVRVKRPPGCIFCLKPKEGRDAENLILVRKELNFVMMNNFPYSPGHLMVSPYRHVADITDLSRPELVEHFELVSQMLRLLREAFQPHGFNVGMNLGKAAGAGYADHIHTHIVPRWEGDHNFMPVIAGTKNVTEAVASTYQRLREKLHSI